MTRLKRDPISPSWRIVDKDGMIRGGVSGAWKGLYDNDLRFHLGDGTVKYVPRDKK